MGAQPSLSGELASLRVPDLRFVTPEKAAQPLTAACERWRASRVDVSDSTRVLHRVALDRVLPILGTRPVDEITTSDVAELARTLAAAGKRRETIRKSVKYLAAVLEECGIDPNPARAKSIRLPHEEREELVPPTAEHVEGRVSAPGTVLPASASVARLVGCPRRLRRHAGRGRLRRAGPAHPSEGFGDQERSALWVELPDVLADAIEATLPPREDRSSDARLFPSVSADRLRTAIARACRAAGVPVFSPHDLRYRRISLLHRQGRTWAEIARFIGQRKLSITADTYTHVISDGNEVAYRQLV